MKLAIWTVTRGAGLAGNKILEKISNTTLFTLKKFNIDNSIQMENFTKTLNENFNEFQGHIFIMATGIVVRKISILIKSKDIDPAVVVLDEGLNFVISLLSGHLGGANELAENLGEKLNMTPIITTSSDVTGKIAVDTLGQKLKSNLESLEKAKNVTSLIVDGKEVELILPKNINSTGKVEGVIINSNREKIEIVQLYPENLVIGLGARKDIPYEIVKEILKETFKKNNLSLKSIKHFATVDIKAKEKAFLQLSEEFQKKLIIVSRKDILEIEEQFEGSDFVKKTIGVRAVSEPCALLTSTGKGIFIEKKIKYKGVTLSIYEERNIDE
ncbi:cobalt-precorrin 5A hydrolase [uncultured Cetobacterium sp.]|uniref:cobalt-precorrin 5A hydrolase n=1 Tax=uncultured Cetobacterium sp. TaxID=527638 RepID=UPI002613EB98|nr:cobalt-precorrin 5A hydrolase [uncultured Cetobacterium sp.]